MSAINAYFKDITKYDVIDANTQNALALRARQGNVEAQRLLIESNLKFVISIARQYVGQGIPLEDLISEGNLGIYKAIENFDPSHGTKFLTYASWWIRQAILQSLSEQKRQVRIPANRIGMIQQYNKTAASMEQELNRDVRESEILEELGVESSDIVRQSSVSYHTEVDAGTTLLDLIPDQETPSPDDSLMRESLIQEINFALRALLPRERTILRMYYGFGYARSYTLEEIGETLNLTRERIRQLRNKAIRELRRMNRRKKLENLKN
jgi:RNA polymerase primary sigma factor